MVIPGAGSADPLAMVGPIWMLVTRRPSARTSPGIIGDPFEFFALLTVVEFAVEGVIEDAERNRLLGRQSDGLVGRVTTWSAM